MELLAPGHASPASPSGCSPLRAREPPRSRPQHCRQASAVLGCTGHMQMASRGSLSSGVAGASLLVLRRSGDPHPAPEAPFPA